MTVAVCDGHAYTAGNGCPRCRQEAKNAWQRERRAERRAARDVLHHQPPARGVPEQVEDDAWREEAACRYDEDQALQIHHRGVTHLGGKTRHLQLPLLPSNSW